MRTVYNAMNSGKITDMDIQALLDGQLNGDDETRVRNALKTDPALQNRYMIYQKQKNILKSWWKDN